MRFFRDVLAVGVAGAVIGLHVYMFMSPKTQKEVERGMRKTVKDMKGLSQQMLRAAKQFG